MTHRILGRRAVVGFGLILLFTSCGQPRATTTKIPDPAALPLADLPLVNAELFETPGALKIFESVCKYRHGPWPFRTDNG